MLRMGVALPFHLQLILLPVDKYRCVSFGIYPEMFDINAVLGKIKIGLVLALLGGRQIVLIGGFVLVDYAVKVEEIGDLAFLETTDNLAL